MKLKTLEDVLSDICKDIRKLGIPLCTRDIKLFLWIDSIDCKPVVGTMSICWNCSVSHAIIIDIIRKIDSISPISMIELKYDKYRIVQYHITKTEEFMKKPCSCYLNKGCK